MNYFSCNFVTFPWRTTWSNDPPSLGTTLTSTSPSPCVTLLGTNVFENGTSTWIEEHQVHWWHLPSNAELLIWNNNNMRWQTNYCLNSTNDLTTIGWTTCIFDDCFAWGTVPSTTPHPWGNVMQKPEHRSFDPPFERTQHQRLSTRPGKWETCFSSRGSTHFRISKLGNIHKNKRYHKRYLVVDYVEQPGTKCADIVHNYTFICPTQSY